MDAIDVIKTFEHFDFLKNVGNQYQDYNCVNTIEQAIVLFKQTDWTAIIQETLNTNWGKLDAVDFATSHDRRGKWNDHTSEYNDNLSISILRNISNKLNCFEATLEIDCFVNKIIRGCYVESFFANEIEPSFHQILSQVLFDGHFPCGWINGEFPVGEMIVW